MPKLTIMFLVFVKLRIFSLSASPPQSLNITAMFNNLLYSFKHLDLSSPEDMISFLKW